ncbi:MAG: indole-3-glycerol phosphate synthase [Desulfovibrionales bacterium]|jgi:indole-3-glycerol phosphate synthase|nr:indole-3-glycerol phosphate synthase [Desulfovibrionales bacterium]
MLEKFRAAKQAEIEALRKLESRGALPEFSAEPKPLFSDALRSKRPCAVIAEYKRASPSKGEINLRLGPAEVAQSYARGGAAALSVLTEQDYFQGELSYLEAAQSAGLPLLRKDFILDPLQIRQTAATSASAVLLIVRMFSEPAELTRMILLAGAAGLEAVVEAFDEKDVEAAQTAGAGIIQVNNRDLDTLQVDLDNARRLIGRKKDGELWIAASGVQSGQDLADMAAAGYDAVLVGSHLMAQDDPGQALRALIREARL